MSAEPKDARPPRMHGIVPAPLEIPPGHWPASKPPKNKRPKLISIIARAYFLFAGAYSLLALALWGGHLGLAGYLLAHKPLVYSLLPFLLLFNIDHIEVSKAAFILVLPIAFLLMGLVSGFVAWKLWNLDPLWFFLLRGVLILDSGMNSFGLMSQAISARHTGAALQSQPALVGPMLVQIPFFIYLFWNLWLFCYLLCDPKVDEACQNFNI